MSILKGYAVATGAPGADHTYVKCDNPAFSWPCWGRDSGGKEICSGSGYASVADCISQPSSHAGIIYAVTGVWVVKDYTVGIKYVNIICYPTRDSNGEKRAKTQVQ
jgi:hypothetical protein